MYNEKLSGLQPEPFRKWTNENVKYDEIWSYIKCRLQKMCCAQFCRTITRIVFDIINIFSTWRKWYLCFHAFYLIEADDVEVKVPFSNDRWKWGSKVKK